jgi:mono/diheme cytochrome c family protein
MLSIKHGGETGAGAGHGRERRGGRGVNWRKIVFAFCLLPFAAWSAACRQDMHDQPKYTPLRPSAFFPDGRSARPLVEGTVAREQLREDVQLYTGKLGAGQQGAVQQGAAQQGGGQQASQPVGGEGRVQPVAGSGGLQQLGSQGLATASESGAANQKGNTVSQQATPAVNTLAGQQQGTQTYQGFATTFPFPIDEAAINRGQERFNIYCSVCHGRTGEGNGPVVLRGYRKPPSLHEARLQNAPAGYIFDVITNGFGAMPDYSAQVSAEDRWKIIAYIRALQLSQRGNLADVPAERRGAIRGGATQQGGQQGEHRQ